MLTDEPHIPRWLRAATRLARMSAVVLKEFVSRSPCVRLPEPMEEMTAASGAVDFHAEGSASGVLTPVYHFNALALSQLLPQGAQLLDLGSGSGQMLAYLARRRPDLRLVGIDLSSEMVALGREMLERSGLAGRVELRVGDMCNKDSVLDVRPGAISSVFSLHHLPSESALNMCCRTLADWRARTGCALWLFDHARPRHADTPEAFPDLVTPEASSAFRRNSRDSLRAAFTFEELSIHLRDAGLSDLNGAMSKWLRVYQAHWLSGVGSGYRPWYSAKLTREQRGKVAWLRRMLPTVPMAAEPPEDYRQADHGAYRELRLSAHD